MIDYDGRCFRLVKFRCAGFLTSRHDKFVTLRITHKHINFECRENMAGNNKDGHSHRLIGPGALFSERIFQVENVDGNERHNRDRCR